jgi:hypothetical protein
MPISKSLVLYCLATVPLVCLSWGAAQTPPQTNPAQDLAARVTALEAEVANLRAAVTLLQSERAPMLPGAVPHMFNGSPYYVVPVNGARGLLLDQSRR